MDVATGSEALIRARRRLTLWKALYSQTCSAEVQFDCSLTLGALGEAITGAP